MEEEKKRRIDLDETNFDDYCKLKKMRVNFELKTQNWIESFKTFVKI